MRKLHPFIESQLRRMARVTHEAIRDLRLGSERAPSGVGFLEIYGFDATTGALRFVDRGKNLVVNSGRSGLAHLTAGDATDNHKVVGIRFGAGSTPPVVSDTGLSGALIIEKAASYDFPDGDSGLKVRFTATVAADEGNGSGTQTYREAALVKGNGDIFSRKLLGVVEKDNTLMLSAIWTIIY